MKKVTFGVIVSTRGFFPVSLAEKGRKEIIAKLENLGYDHVILSEADTKYGVVETYKDAKKCAEIFKANRDRIDGIIVILPNFGDEVGVVNAIKLSELNVPVLVQASDDDLDKMDIAHRRDSFCGKISVTANLYQYGIRYTDTTLHSCAINSDVFSEDIHYFAKICRVVNGLRKARIGAIGARPGAFQTVRFSEKLLQASGVTVIPVDLSEIMFAALKMENTPEVIAKVKEIKSYGKIIPGISEEKILKQAKFILVVEKWLSENECDASAITCWTSIELNYGIAPCLAMSMMGEKGMPSACEMDITGALSMYALYLASGEPSGYLDWNNSYKDDRNKCINIHCSNFPKSFMGRDFEIGNLDVLSQTVGEDITFGPCKANVAGGPMTYAKISTDDTKGKIKAYIGEGEFTDDPVETGGAPAVVSINDLQGLMHYIGQNGFEHHIAMNRSRSAKILAEALGKYLGWDLYIHKD